MGRLGSEPRVIFAHGEVLTEPATGRHWNQERASAGEESPFIEIQIDDLRDPLGRTAVPISELSEKLGQLQNWTPQQSGIEIKPQAATLLAQLWQRETSEPSRFVGQQVFVFTAGNEEARKHLRDSIEAPVDLARALRT